MNVMIILMLFDSASMLEEGIFFAPGFIRTLFYHFNLHVYHVCAVGGVGGVGWKAGLWRDGLLL